MVVAFSMFTKIGCLRISVHLTQFIFASCAMRIGRVMLSGKLSKGSADLYQWFPVQPGLHWTMKRIGLLEVFMAIWLATLIGTALVFIFA